MERYWMPSNAESALFGTQIADRFFHVTPGGDIGFLNGALKHLIERGGSIALRRRAHRRLRGAPRALDGYELGRARAARPARAARDVEAFAGCSARRSAACSSGAWASPSTAAARTACRAIVNLGLARGFVGREKCGLMPIRGHSGVQGGAEMGAYATAFPGGLADRRRENADRARRARGASTCRRSAGSTRAEMIDAAARGELDLLVRVGGNFVDVLPEPDAVEAALARIPLRVHMDIVLDARCSSRRPTTVVLLPAHDALRGCRAAYRDHHRAAGDLQPRRSRGRESARRARSGRIFRDLARARPSRSWPTRCASTARRGDPRGDRAS